MSLSSIGIAAAERETGISKDVLRVWERRYGFPVPSRDANGERMYPLEQIAKLRQIKRLMDLGHRPGKLIAMPDDAFRHAESGKSADDASARPPRSGDAGQSEQESTLEECLMLIKQHDTNAYMQRMQQNLARYGLKQFVQDIVAPLTQRVGAAWEAGVLEIFEEHLFTELTNRMLRQTISGLRRSPGAPRVLLTSLPGEPHAIGLLMVEALLALEGADCIPLGSQTPMLQICQAAIAHEVDIVTLSFSASYPRRQIPELLSQLREILPVNIALWVGGGGTVRVNPPPGVNLLTGFEECLRALSDWRNSH